MLREALEIIRLLRRGGHRSSCGRRPRARSARSTSSRRALQESLPVTTSPNSPSPAPAPAQGSPRPSVTTAAPRTTGYWVGGALFAVLTGAGIVVGAVGSEPPRPVPDFVAEVEGEGQATFEVGDGEEGRWAVFTTDVNDWTCTHVTPSGQAAERTFEGSYTSDDGRWYLNGILDTSEPGTHTFACSGGAGISRGIASMDTVEAAEGRGTVMGATALALAAAGLLGGGGVAGATVLRRRAHQRRTAPTA